MATTVRLPARHEFRAAAAPDWATRYRGADYPYVGLAADCVVIALSSDATRLELLSIARREPPFADQEAIPGGMLQWLSDHDTETTARRELREETGVEAPGYFERLDTFDENGRDPRQWAGQQKGNTWEAIGVRIASVAYLAILDRHDRPEPSAADDAVTARWADVYELLPWEDTRRTGWLDFMRTITRWLDTHWVGAAKGDAHATRAARLAAAFGTDRKTFRTWNEETTELRFRVLRDAGVLLESHRNHWGEQKGEPPMRDAFLGDALAFDHRLILSVALGRVRGKVKYVPSLLAALVGDGAATMAELHQALETVSGRWIYRPNLFRVLTERRGVVIPSASAARRKPGQRGVSPTLYRFARGTETARLDPSMRIPWRPTTWHPKASPR
jgi:hypothetical protein